MEWAMTELLRHPDKLQRVFEELDAIIDVTNSPTGSFANATHAERDHCRSRLHYLKNSNIFFNVWAIQRDAEFLENPLQFEPERFLNVIEKRNYKGNSFDFFPFGSGRRICVGISMAEKIIMLMLATLHCFEWKLPNRRKPDVKEQLHLLLSKVEPLVVVPISRSSKWGYCD
ncbi:hypothetical protein GOBAR_AA30034 [Gossypium barbadense]|uniref:Cytochrome P450 n=1 Tax=Gossypium barbadense TaxID=3634 RepID=A0A2P5WHU4_GOSBA|nr:hypothetical protein GOBAR_AA30034 [Gossypium barbadense]